MTAPLDLADPVEGSGLLELAARVEALSGPDREIDALIYHVAIAETWPNYKPSLVVHAILAPHYTESVDDAMTLVPEEAFWRLGHDGDGADPSEFRAQVIVPMLGGKDPQGVAIASTPALALVAASLRAQPFARLTQHDLVKGE